MFFFFHHGDIPQNFEFGLGSTGSVLDCYLSYHFELLSLRCRQCQSQHTYTVNMSLINKKNLHNISSKRLTLLFFFSLPTPGEVVEDGLSCTVFPRLDRIIDSFWAFERKTIFKNPRNLVSSALSRWQTIAKEIFRTEKISNARPIPSFIAFQVNLTDGFCL